MIDLAGAALDAVERDILTHPLVGGVILFARNFESPEQLRRLTSEIRALRDPKLLISVDHEGGRVQRFKQGFTHIPAMRRLGILADRDRALALATAEAAGCVLAAELLSRGVDFSFTPVLDVDFGASSVIGDRAFDSNPTRVGELAGALLHGMGQAGMAGVGKHFPGHGHVRADSHVAVPIDERELARIDAEDMVPYRMLIPRGLAGVMPAHVIYPKVDSRPAGFSEIWLMRILREQLEFDGMIFSDDLSMKGASVAGDMIARAKAALDAGCDMVLVCNAPNDAVSLLDGLEAAPLHELRSERMRGQRKVSSEIDLRYAAALKTLQDAFA
ncbi:MAG: beta-N-acetylhexosaminidase [Betaproteobacteria bacterium RIFCSPLOWO2_02_FULL_63_19]|nr:MAG: beta-N-acetylhexosaminidase [Betaproteobacteria bacterium RIFCSPLOWO2_02_FULL_63_19]